MKKSGILLTVLCLALVVGVLSCASTGGGAAKKGTAYGKEITGLTWSWGPFTDIENGGSSTIDIVESEEGGQTVRSMSGEITNQYEYGFVGWFAEPPQDTPEEAATLEALQKAKGFTFKVIGDGQRYAFKVLTSDVKDYCYYETVFGTEEGVEETIHITIEMLVQPTWGTYAPFKQENAVHLEWQTTNNGRPGTFALKIWDLRAYE